jgi:hypothetical protein
MDITSLLTVFTLTNPVNFPCVRKPKHPEKNDFRQSVDWLFSNETVARSEPTNLEVQGACSNDSATRNQSRSHWGWEDPPLLIFFKSKLVMYKIYC